jgi:hypothetical protein
MSSCVCEVEVPGPLSMSSLGSRTFVYVKGSRFQDLRVCRAAHINVFKVPGPLRRMSSRRGSRTSAAYVKYVGFEVRVRQSHGAC